MRGFGSLEVELGSQLFVHRSYSFITNLQPLSLEVNSARGLLHRDPPHTILDLEFDPA